MKKILTMALCLGVTGTMFAQKAAVDQAAKLSGKADKIEEARQLIKQASENPETAKDARTYYVGGKIEYDLYDTDRKKQMINPKDASIDPEKMYKHLLDGYKMYVIAMPLDSVPDAKGKVKPKYAKDIANDLNSSFSDFWNAGGTFYNNKKYYPEAYEAFMVYGDMPKQAYANKFVKETPDSLINSAFFNAGISAYAGKAIPESIKAFKSARLNNTDNPQNYIYELACWQYLAQTDSTMEPQAQVAIEEIAQAGHKKFGINQMIFMNNLINTMLQNNRTADAMAMINEQIAAHPDKAALYGLRGYVNDRLGKDNESVEDYRKAAAMPDVDFETLKNASKKIFRTGTAKWNDLQGNAPAERQAIKADYFEAAKEMADRAKKMNPDDSDVDNLIESLDYALTTFFNN